jgi:hypothetical protein
LGRLFPAVTENRYGGVVFEGVCSDLSNAAYPVEEVRRSVEPSFEPPWVDAAVHLGLTLLHHGYVVHQKGGSFALSEEAQGARSEDRLVADVCETVEPRVADDDAGPEMAAFVGFVREVMASLTGEEQKV